MNDPLKKKLITKRNWFYAGGFVCVIAFVCVVLVWGVLSEQETEKRIGDQALEVRRAVAQPIRDAHLNFVADETMRNEQFEDELIKLARESGVPLQTVAVVLTDVLAARGSLTNREVFEHVRQTLRLNSDPEWARVVAVASADLANAGEIKDPKITLGFMLNIQEASYVKDLKMVAQNLVPAIIEVTAYGDTLEQAAELAATMTQLTSDKTGVETGKAIVQLAKQLDGFDEQLEVQRAALSKDQNH